MNGRMRGRVEAVLAEVAQLRVADDVAQFFRAGEVRGVPNSESCCVIARFVCSEIPEIEGVSVEPGWVGRGGLVQVGMVLFDECAHRFDSVDLSEAMSWFALGFDAGAYLDLIEDLNDRAISQ